jgi:hypothetical protein
MITTRLEGGLGNQMFQVAVAYAMARRNKDDSAFDFSESSYVENVLSQFAWLPDGWTSKLEYVEVGFDYNQITYHPDMHLYGYFQTEKYFSDYKDDVIRMFTNQTIIDYLRSLFCWNNSVSIHVRHGDYLRFNTWEELPSMDYYNRALNIISQHSQIDRIFVFSDDIEWCKEKFNDSRIIFVGDGCWFDYRDLYFMSLCKHNIIANSTFSWWGSYLNTNKNKIIVAPDQWNKNGNTDIYSKSMIVIPK